MLTRGTFYKSEVCVRSWSPSIFGRLWGSPSRISASSFFYQTVLKDAVARAGLGTDPTGITVPDEEWWKRLCGSCQEKVTSKTGGHLLREKLVHHLSQRLAVEDCYRLNRDEIEKCEVKEPVFLIGLPRCNAHMAQFAMARSGIFLTPLTRDTMFPSIATDFERTAKYNSVRRQISSWKYPFLQTVREIRAEFPEDDTCIHLQCPQSIAWGLLHGLDDHLYKTLQEDQTPVFEYTKRILKLFQWYHESGTFPDNVEREYTATGVPYDDTIRGSRIEITHQPWVIQSPFALMYIEVLHNIFPDMKLIWVHRALNQCIPSLCSSLAIHNTLYTGRRPTETQLANLGEQVVGVFGSGSEYAIDYLSTFPFSRMVHWSNKEVQRSLLRLINKTLFQFDIEWDFYRKQQTISGMTEYTQIFRPKHDYELGFFGLHDGMLGEAFQAYCLQFEEYAFEKKWGIVHQEFKPLSDFQHELRMGANRKEYGDQQHYLGATSTAHAGTYLQQDSANFKR